MIYLASPYSHPDGAVRSFRYYAALFHTRDQLFAGNVMFSPICYGHPFPGLPGDHEFWWRIGNHPYLRVANHVEVLTLDGWRESRGIRLELDYARDHGKAIVYVEPSDEVIESAKRHAFGESYRAHI